MSFQLPFGVRVLNPVPVDNKYFNTGGTVYTSTSQVNAQIPVGIRHKGLTVNVNNVEYWYETGTSNASLVAKAPSIANAGGITGATNGLTKTGANVRLGGNLDSATSIGLGANNLTITGTTGTLRYGSDLSANYNVRSLVDAGYVTGLTSQRLLTSAFNTYSGNTANLLNLKIQTANNGLTKSGINVRLGGILTGNTTINADTNALTLSATGAGSLSLTAANGNAVFDNTGWQIQNGSTDINGIINDGIVVTLDGTETFRYAVDYSGNFTDRSFVDKAYVDSIAVGFDPKASVRVATTAPITGTYSPSGGVNGQFTSVSTTVVDGITIANGNRILVKNQADPKQNGIYVRTTATVWDRASDQNGSPASEVSTGNYVFVTTGATQTATGWVVAGSGDLLTLNTDPINWVQFTASISSYNAGTGISITGATISNTGVVTANNGLTKNGVNARLGGTLTGATTINGLNTSNRLSFGAFPVQYVADYSANFDNRSLVDVGYVSGLTSQRLLTSAFNTYSASTLTNINTRVNSANNGLTKNGTNVRLGGALTGNTTINGGLISNLALVSLTSFSATTSNNSIVINNGGINISAIGSSNNLNMLFDQNLSIQKNGNPDGIFYNSLSGLRLLAGFTNKSSIRIDSNDILISGNTGSFGGLKYAANYSGNINFTSRSLVDKGYVDGLVAASSASTTTTANNGLTKSGTNIRLGGTLTGSTKINTNFSFIVGANDINNGAAIFTDGTQVVLQNYLSGTGSSVIVNQNQLSVGSGYVRSSYDITAVTTSFDDGFTPITILDRYGIRYSADYSANFTPRSLVDKAYVTGLTSNIQLNKLSVTLVSANFTATTTNHVILVNTSAARTITLPASPVDGQVYHIKDRTGNALSNNITVAGNGNNIDGSSSASINTNYGSLYLVYSLAADEWYTLAFIS
jgi:hypothetical protein